MERTFDVTYCPVDPVRPGPYAQYLLPRVSLRARREPERFIALGAAWERYTVGAAAVSLGGSDPKEAVLESLFVDPGARGRGVGTALMDRAAEAAREAGAEALTFNYALAGPELEAMNRMVENLGGEAVFRLPVYTMDSADYRDSPLLGRAFTGRYRKPEGVVLFTELTPEQRQALDEDPEVPWYVRPRRRVEMLPELSLAYVQDGRVAGFWMGSITTPGNYSVQGVWRSSAAPATTFHTLLNAHLNHCFYHCGGDFLYHCSPAVELADRLIQRYSGGKYRRLEEYAARIELQ